MGLLDVFLNGTGNAEQDAAINRGLLAAGLQLMQSRGRLFPAIGQAGMAGLGASDAYRQQTEAQKRAQLQDQLLKGQLTQQQQQQEQQQRMQQWLQGLQSPQMQASQAALAGGGGPTVENAAKLQPVDPQQQLMFDAVRNGALPLPAYLAAQQKDTSPIISKPGEVARDRQGRILWQNPAEAPKEDDFVQNMRKAGIDPASPQGQKLMAAWLEKQSTHSPQVQVSYGAPVAGVDQKTGNPVFFQPSKDGKSPPSIVEGVKPAPQNRDTKLPAELQRMNIAADAMGTMLDQYEAMLKKYNPRDIGVQSNPAVRAEFQSLMKNMQLQFKEVQALGALAGPDLALMDAALSDPFTFKGVMYGREGLLGQVKQARNLLKLRKDATLRSQGQQTGQPAETDNDPLGIRK